MHISCHNENAGKSHYLTGEHSATMLYVSFQFPVSVIEGAGNKMTYERAGTHMNVSCNMSTFCNAVLSTQYHCQIFLALMNVLDGNRMFSGRRGRRPRMWKMAALLDCWSLEFPCMLIRKPITSTTRSTLVSLTTVELFYINPWYLSDEGKIIRYIVQHGFY